MRFAVDTNVLFDQATDDPDVLDALAVIRERLPDSTFIVTPTVLHELAHKFESGDNEERAAAERALSCLLPWGYEPLNLIPARHGIVEQIGMKLRVRGVIPEEEVHDALIIAEAALMDCAILLSSDGHLDSAHRDGRLHELLKEHHVSDILIARPRDIVRKFFRQR